MMLYSKYSQTTQVQEKINLDTFFMLSSRPRLQTIFCEYFEYYETKVTILAE